MLMAIEMHSFPCVLPSEMEASSFKSRSPSARSQRSILVCLSSKLPANVVINAVTHYQHIADMRFESARALRHCGLCDKPAVGGMLKVPSSAMKARQ